MKTTLPDKIETLEQAKKFLKELFDNNEAYHCEDDAHELDWITCEKPSNSECDQLNKLMTDIYDIDGNKGNHLNPTFDPCKYIMDLRNIEMHKPAIIAYLKAFGSIWDFYMEVGDEENIKKLTDSYVIFTDALKLPKLSADELIIELCK